MSLVLDNSKDDEKNENEAKNSESEEEKDEQGIIQEVHMKPEGAELSVSSNVVSNNVSNVIQGAVDPTSNVLMNKFMIVDQFGQQNLISLLAQSTFMVQNSAQGNLFLSPVGELQMNNAMHGNNGFMFQHQQIPAVPNIANHGVGNRSVANPGMSNVNPVTSEVVDNSGGGNPIVGNPVLGNDTPGDDHDSTPGDNPAVENNVPKQDVPNIMPAVVPDNPVDPAVPDPAVVNPIQNTPDVLDKCGGGGNGNPVLGNGAPGDVPVGANSAVPNTPPTVPDREKDAVANPIRNASDVLDKCGSGENANPVLGNGAPGDVPVSANSAVPNTPTPTVHDSEKDAVANPIPNASDVLDKSGSGGNANPVLGNGAPGDAPTVSDSEKDAIANGSRNVASTGECPESSVKEDAIPNTGDGCLDITNVTPNVPNRDDDAPINDPEKLKNEHGNDCEKKPSDVRNGDSKGESTKSGVVNSTSDERVETKSAQIQRNSTGEDTSSTDAGVRERFVNYLGGKAVIANPIDVMHAENKILPLYKICRSHLGINRDTAAAFSSYSKMKAYYHKFQSPGTSERRLSVSQVDGDDEVTIYVKTGSYFYCRTNCPVPDRRVESSNQKEEPVSKSTKLKTTKKGRSRKFSKTKKKKDNITWDSFDSKSLKALGKRLAEEKTGYEFGPQYDFREFFWQSEWNSIISRSLVLSSKNDKTLVPLKPNILDGDDKSDTEGYSENER